VNNVPLIPPSNSPYLKVLNNVPLILKVGYIVKLAMHKESDV